MSARSDLDQATAEAPDAAPPAPRKAPDAAALSEFFGSLAHDLRSPLGVVSEALNELRTELAGSLTDDHRLLVSLAERGILRLGRIADTVSLLAALESSTFALRTQPIDLVALLREAATAAESRRDVVVTCDLPDGPCVMTADGDRLSRAVVEIVINAVRHARRSVLVSLTIAPGEARVVVEDDGPGVATASRDNLFRRFTRRASRSGLGMGLSIAHDVVAAHGGQITLEASTLPAGRPGTTGARFVVTLPQVEPQTGPRAEPT